MCVLNYKYEPTIASGKISHASGQSETLVHPGHEISQRRGIHLNERRSHAREHAQDGTAQRPERGLRGVPAPTPYGSPDFD